MTDNEQIIIHGIDVSKCKFYRPGSFPTDCEINPVNAYCESPTSSNCYFKQLARKTQECEELKSELDLYKTWYRAKHGDIKNTLGTYYEALRDIKNITKDIIENDCYENSDTKANKILGIINKVKG